MTKKELSAANELDHLKELLSWALVILDDNGYYFSQADPDPRTLAMEYRNASKRHALATCLIDRITKDLEQVSAGLTDKGADRHFSIATGTNILQFSAGKDNEAAQAL